MRKVLFTIFIFLFFPLFLVNAETPNLSNAFSNSKTASGLNNFNSKAGLSQVAEPEYIVANFIQKLLSFLGVIFLILTIYGGITWMTARGNKDAVEKAKTIMSRAIIGLGIILGAYAITAFVFQSSLFFK